MAEIERFSIRHNSEKCLFFITDNHLNLEVGRVTYRSDDSQLMLPTKDQALAYALLYTGREDQRTLISQWREIAASAFSDPRITELGTLNPMDLSPNQQKTLVTINQMIKDYNSLADALEEMLDRSEGVLTAPKQNVNEVTPEA